MGASNGQQGPAHKDGLTYAFESTPGTKPPPSPPSPTGLLATLDRLAVAVEELVTEVRAYRTEQAAMKMAQMEDPFQRMSRE